MELIYSITINFEHPLWQQLFHYLTMLDWENSEKKPTTSKTKLSNPRIINISSLTIQEIHPSHGIAEYQSCIPEPLSVNKDLNINQIKLN